MQSLTIKQVLFVENYLKTRNGREAAELAGYKGDDATLRQVASENLTKPNIRAEIDKRLRSTILSSNQVLAELSEIAFAPWREFTEIITDKDGSTIQARLKLTDKLKALELLGKYHKLFTDRVEIVDPAAAARAAYEAILDETKIAKERAKEIVLGRFPDVSESELVIDTDRVM